jgi:hypothetical protein
MPRSTQQPARTPGRFLGFLLRAAVWLISGSSLMYRILSTFRAPTGVPRPWVRWPATFEEILGFVK